MNKQLFGILLFCLVVLSANCQKNQSSSYNISNSGDGKLSTHHMTINNDGTSEEAYRQAAKTVSSDYEFGKVMRALE